MSSIASKIVANFTRSDPATVLKNILPFGVVNEFVNPFKQTNFEMVKTFMEIMGQEVKTSPNFPSPEVLELRMALIIEEVAELEEGVQNNDLINVAKELTDILYVIYGMGHSLGIDLDATFREVQASNLSKLDDNGNPILRESDGKVLKGPNYFEPNIAKVIY